MTCECGAQETVTHVLLECPFLDINIRNYYLYLHASNNFVHNKVTFDFNEPYLMYTIRCIKIALANSK